MTFNSEKYREIVEFINQKSIEDDIFLPLIIAITKSHPVITIKQAIEIWKNGYGGVLPNETHAKNLQNIVE